MENSTERLFKGFSLEDYRLQVLMNKLEKEKKQCLDRLREEKHVFKMSIRPPVISGEECWSQYGEIFHANGDKRETESITNISMELNKEEDVKNPGTASQDSNTSNLQKLSSRMILTPPEPLQICSGANAAAQRSYLQRMREKSDQKRKDSKKKTKSAGLTLLKILCADFENGTLLVKRKEGEDESGDESSLANLDREHFEKGSATKVEKKPFLSNSDKSVKSSGNVKGDTQSRADKNSPETTQSEDGNTAGNSNSSNIRPQSVNLGGRNFSNSSQKSLIISLETVALDDRSGQNRSCTSEDFTNISEKGKIGTDLHSTASQPQEGKYLRRVKKKPSNNAQNNEKAIFTSHASLAEKGLEEQTLENSKFVHFREGRKPSKRNNRKDECADRNKGNEKLNRTRSPGVKLFQVDGLQNPQRRKSQAETDKETRQKMDQFFARVEHTKLFQESKPRWRCSSGVDSSARKTERKTFLDSGRRVHGGKKEQGYRRARPWPIQVWS